MTISFLTYPIINIFEDIKIKSGFDFLEFPMLGNKYYFFDPELTFEPRLYKHLSYFQYETREDPFICAMWNRGALNATPEQPRQFTGYINSSLGYADKFTVKNVQCQLNLVFVSNDPNYLTAFEEFFIINYDRSITLKTTYKVPVNFKELGNITSVNQGTKTFTIEGEYSYLNSGDSLSILESTGNNGDYTVVSKTVSSGFTNIIVSENIPNSVADGVMVKNGYLEEIEADVFFNGIEFSGLDKLETGSRGELTFLLVTMNIQYPVILNSNYTGSISGGGSYKLIKHINLKTKAVKSLVNPQMIQPYAEMSIDAIVSVDTVNRKFSIGGDYTSYFVTGKTFIVRNSTGNDGTYTVVSSILSGNKTIIEVSEDIVSIVADGNTYL